MATLAQDLAVALVFVAMLAGIALVEALLHLFTKCRGCARCDRGWWLGERAGRERGGA